MKRIDFNADVGEGEAGDVGLLELVSSCNVACGGHAGDGDSMARTVTAALRLGVTIGAHPSYPDRDGFGRKSGFLEGRALYEALSAQVQEFAAIAAELGARTAHVKLHGALYGDASRDAALAEIAARVAAELPGRVALVAPAGSALEDAAARAGLAFIAEAFVDRRYLADGSLVPREEAGAVLDSVPGMVAQALALATAGSAVTGEGTRIRVRADTLCIHGDTAGAVDAARAVRAALVAQGFAILAPHHDG